MSLSIEVAVSTMDMPMDAAHARDLVRSLGLHGDSQLGGAPVNVLVINQVSGPVEPPILKPNLRVFSFRERGLSRSRNRALSLSHAELLLLADDDICYLPGFEKQIQQAFSKHPGIAFCSFQFVNRDTGQLARRYPVRNHVHRQWTVPSVSSVEIVLRPARLANLRFDERFGLGAAYNSGEEAIFLHDALKAGARGHFEPTPLCDHPGLSSGHDLWNRQTTRSKGAILRRLYPHLWPIPAVAFAATKHKNRARGTSTWRFAGDLIGGAAALGSASDGPTGATANSIKDTGFRDKL